MEQGSDKGYGCQSGSDCHLLAAGLWWTLQLALRTPCAPLYFALCLAALAKWPTFVSFLALRLLVNLSLWEAVTRGDMGGEWGNVLQFLPFWLACPPIHTLDQSGFPEAFCI